MDKYGLIGFPLGHSFSAKYFNNKFATEGIDAEYVNFETKEISKVRDIVAQNKSLKGLNITIPHKEGVMPFLDNLSDNAKEIGAVNTIKVVRDADGEFTLEGFNTDYIGFRKSIEPLIDSNIHTRALVMGTGGASKAVVKALEDMNINWKYVSRSEGSNRITYNDIDKYIIDSHKVIINCSPLGTYPKTDECPDLPYDFIDSNHLLYDLVYNPAETLFLKKGKEKGATTKNGADMLELQALAAWEIWNS